MYDAENEGLMNQLALRYERHRCERARKRRLKQYRRLVPMYYAGYEQRKSELEALVRGGASRQDVEAKLYDIKSSILWPLADMGYLQRNAFALSLRRYARDLQEIDEVFADIYARLKLS